MPNLLMIAGHAAATEEVRDFLVDVGHGVSLATVQDGMRMAADEQPDLILVHEVACSQDRIALLGSLRGAHVSAPAIATGSDSDMHHRIDWLNAGGDDYLAVPFALPELEARIRAILRRRTTSPAMTLTVGELRLDLLGRVAYRGERRLNLLPREFQILEFMMRHAGQTLTRGMLFAKVWNYKFELSPNLIDVHLGKLRRKLNAPGEENLIENVKGVGFRLNEGAGCGPLGRYRADLRGIEA